MDGGMCGGMDGGMCGGMDGGMCGGMDGGMCGGMDGGMCGGMGGGGFGGGAYGGGAGGCAYARGNMQRSALGGMAAMGGMAATQLRPGASNVQRRPGDWDCANCGEMNFARRTECKACGAPRGN